MIKRIGLLLVLFPVVCMADSVVPIDAVEESVNIRLSPDATSEIVGKLEQGSSAELVNSIEGWHEVKLVGGATGFISADWTRVLTDAELAVSVEATTSAEEVTAEEIAEVVEEAIEEVAEEAVVEEAVVEAVATEETVAAEAIVEDVVEPVVAPAAEEAEVPVMAEAVEEATAAETSTQPNLKGSKDFLVKFRNENEGESSQIFDNGNQVGIGTTEPKQRLEVNGSIQIHEQNSSVAGLMI
ncbi:MAG: hypothetical protein OEW73_13195, partial [Gammaproteobacteria bacterium]|nr:hypothetical protein [Gammaproteobacteria bacterium]